MMHRFLNMSDGLVTTSGKKIVFSTNLGSLKSVDQALIRPGRCYDVCQHRALNADEARAVLEETGVQREIENGKNYTLAELMMNQPSDGVKKTTRRVGFVQ
jgi:ATP-dependent 26S proteasome regulatory subunit